MRCHVGDSGRISNTRYESRIRGANEASQIVFFFFPSDPVTYMSGYVGILKDLVAGHKKSCLEIFLLQMELEIHIHTNLILFSDIRERVTHAKAQIIIINTVTFAIVNDLRLSVIRQCVFLGKCD